MTATDFFRIALIILTGYLIGSAPVAYLIAKIKNVNIFEVGSGNMGATNVIRALGFWWGIAVWVLDMSKGIIAMGIAAQVIWPEHYYAAATIAAIAAVVGHNWSVFAARITGTLRGGKGAAVWFGTILVMTPFQVILGLGVLGTLVIAATRYVSLAVLLMTIVCTVWVVILVGQNAMPSEYLYYFLVAAVMIAYRFRENIQRLLAGTERRLGEGA